MDVCANAQGAQKSGEVEKAAQKSWRLAGGWKDEGEFARKRNIRREFQAKV